MADVDLLYGDSPGFDFRNKVPTGGVTGGAPFDPGTLSSPVSNPFGGDQEAITRRQLDAFRSEAKQRGLKVDEGDAIAYQQMQRGFSGLPSLMPDQFDDPYTKQLEGIAKAQMGEVRSNPGLDQFKAFLQNQFNDLSTAPGFSPAELAVLNTQALEPIEDLRQASKKRALERASAAGYLPTSGITGLREAPNGGLEHFDTAYDRMRTQANRDLAVNAIDRRDQDLQRAMTYAQMLGLTIPQGQRSEELNLARMLQRLPSESLTDLLAVLNGSPTSMQLGNQAQQTAYQQELERQRNAQMWQEIIRTIGGLNF